MRIVEISRIHLTIGVHCAGVDFYGTVESN